jgi:hypothetical protein
MFVNDKLRRNANNNNNNNNNNNLSHQFDIFCQCQLLDIKGSVIETGIYVSVAIQYPLIT